MAQESEWFDGRSADEIVHERCHRRRVGGLIFLALAAAMILFPLITGCAANVERKSPYDGPPLIVTSRDGSVRLTKEPCQNVSGWLAMSTAEMVYQGAKYLACWVMVGNVVVIFDSAGDVTPVPANAFKKEEGV